MSFIDAYSDFVRRHGGDPIFSGGYFLFADGAFCDRSGMVCAEPPTDRRQFLKARQRYLRAKLDSEMNEFQAFQSECGRMAYFASQNPSCCPPPADAADQLRRGKERIETLRRELAEIERELASSHAFVGQALANLDRDRRYALDQQAGEIKSVNID